MSRILEITDRYYRTLEAGTAKGSVKIWDKLEKSLGVPQQQLRYIEKSKK